MMCPAASITKAASKQTYYTIRLLADRERVDDAFRAYAYMRWVDDRLDGNGGSQEERTAFLQRQFALLEACYRGETPADVSLEEEMLVELVRRNPARGSGVETYLRNLMMVMQFDLRRRGRPISQVELAGYTRLLAVGVAEAMHYFIGYGDFAPQNGSRYMAVTGAHITHMLRDTAEDARSGYYNIPLEVLEAGHLEPHDVGAGAYRDWVKCRVGLARRCFQLGKQHYARLQNARHRLAGLCYVARFEWLLDRIEADGFLLRRHYHQRKGLGAALGIAQIALSSLMELRPGSGLTQRATSRRADQG